jgi:hypothetical protein
MMTVRARWWAALLLICVASGFGAAAAPAHADTSQAGCQAYGAFVADTAHALNSATTPGGGGAFISGIATSQPGALASTATFLKQQTCP